MVKRGSDFVTAAVAVVFHHLLTVCTIRRIYDIASSVPSTIGGGNGDGDGGSSGCSCLYKRVKVEYLDETKDCWFPRFMQEDNGEWEGRRGER